MDDEVEIADDVESIDEESIDEGALLALDERGGWDIKTNTRG